MELLLSNPQDPGARCRRELAAIFGPVAWVESGADCHVFLVRGRTAPKSCPSKGCGSRGPFGDVAVRYEHGVRPQVYGPASEGISAVLVLFLYPPIKKRGAFNHEGRMALRSLLSAWPEIHSPRPAPLGPKGGDYEGGSSRPHSRAASSRIKP